MGIFSKGRGEEKAMILSVMSGKGGTGKSTLSASIGKIAAKRGKRVLLIDLDAGLGSLDLMLGMENLVFDLNDALDGRCSAMDAVYPHSKIENLYLATAPMVNGDAFSFTAAIPLFEEYHLKFDLVLLDLPAGLSMSVAAANISSGVIVVTTPDAIAVRDAQRLSVLLPDIPARLLINKVSKATMKAGGLIDLDEAIDLAGMQLLGVVPFDPFLASAKRDPQTEEIVEAIVSRIEGKYVPIILRSV